MALRGWSLNPRQERTTVMWTMIGVVLFLTFLVMLLGGCSGFVVEHQEEFQARADQQLDTARAAFCYGPRLGAMQREYAGNLEGLRDHLVACGWDEDTAQELIEGL